MKKLIGNTLMIQVKDITFILNNQHIIKNIPKEINDYYFQIHTEAPFTFIEVDNHNMISFVSNLPFILDYNEYETMDVAKLREKKNFFYHQELIYEEKIDRYADSMSEYIGETRFPDAKYNEYRVEQLEQLISEKERMHVLRLSQN